MQAIVMTHAGGPDVLKLTDLPVPTITDPRQILVRLHAAGLNPVDTKIRSTAGYYPDKLPAILGCDGAGTVEEIGSGVMRFRPGDAVYFFNGGIGDIPGNYAEFAVVHEDYVARKPRSLSMEEAAAAPLAVITAWETLFDRAQLTSGQRVLIHAGAGGVGHIAIQLARARGIHVATTVSGEDKTAFVKGLGAERVIDYRKEDFVASTLDWTKGQGVDAVFDTVGGDTYCRSFGATRVYGRVVTLLQSECTQRDLKTARTRNLSLIYELMLTPMHLGMHEARIAQRQILESAAALMDSGALRIQVSQTFPLREAAHAHQRLGDGHTLGKMVFRIVNS